MDLPERMKTMSDSHLQQGQHVVEL